MPGKPNKNSLSSKVKKICQRGSFYIEVDQTKTRINLNDLENLMCHSDGRCRMCVRNGKLPTGTTRTNLKAKCGNQERVWHFNYHFSVLPLDKGLG